MSEPSTKPPEPERCKRCGGQLLPGIAMQSTLVGWSDFPGQEVVTMHEGGPGRLIPCLKCVACGWSVTAV